MTGTDRDTAQLWSTRFRRERVASWQELDKLVGAIERRGIRDLPAEALARLPALYRAALSSLSVARAVCLDRNLLAYLEALTARAHLCVYGPRESILAGLIRFVRDRPPNVSDACARCVRAARQVNDVRDAERRQLLGVERHFDSAQKQAVEDLIAARCFSSRGTRSRAATNMHRRKTQTNAHR